MSDSIVYPWVVECAKQMAGNLGLEGSPDAVQTIIQGIQFHSWKWREALEFYAKHIHWMPFTSNDSDSQLLVAHGRKFDGTSNGWVVAEDALRFDPYPPEPPHA